MPAVALSDNPAPPVAAPPPPMTAPTASTVARLLSEQRAAEAAAARVRAGDQHRQQLRVRDAVEARRKRGAGPRRRSDPTTEPPADAELYRLHGTVMRLQPHHPAHGDIVEMQRQIALLLDRSASSSHPTATSLSQPGWQKGVHGTAERLQRELSDMQLKYRTLYEEGVKGSCGVPLPCDVGEEQVPPKHNAPLSESLREI
eukprot:gene15708-23381_t